MFQLSQLRCFVAVATELHFGRAATLLNMTQPPLTRQIQLLEHELGAVLLKRAGGSSVQLTPAGLTFLREAEDILRRVQSATLVTRRAMRAEIGSVSMGFAPPAAFSVLPRLLAAAHQELPDVHLGLREMQTVDQLEALGADTIELAIVRPFTPRPFAESAVLLREPFVFAAPAGHPLATGGAISLSALDGQDFIQFCPSESRHLFEMVAGRLQAGGVAPQVVQSLSHTLTILSLVDAGMGVSLVPQSAQRLRYEGVVFRDIADAPGLDAELHLAWRRGGNRPLADRVRAVMLRDA